MKTKYIAALALATWLLVTLWLASMVIAKPAVLRLNGQAEETATMAELRTAIARNQQVLATLPALRSLPTVSAAPGQLVALPVTAAPGDASTMASLIGGNAAPDAMEAGHRLSMVLIANGRRTAVMDGQHVRSGTRLRDGSRIAGIGPDWVRVIQPDGKPQVYRIRNPLLDAAGGAP